MLGRRSKGLTRNVTCKSAPEGFDGRLVAELWVYPDGSRILKLSTKCAPSEAFQRAAEARPFLMGRGVDLAGDQELKTRTALEFFSGNLEAAAAGSYEDSASTRLERKHPHPNAHSGHQHGE
jgi:hypothetical protein